MLYLALTILTTDIPLGNQVCPLSHDVCLSAIWEAWQMIRLLLPHNQKLSFPGPNSARVACLLVSWSGNLASLTAISTFD